MHASCKACVDTAVWIDCSTDIPFNFVAHVGVGEEYIVLVLMSVPTQ